MRVLDWQALDERARTAAMRRPALRDDAALQARVREIVAEVRRDGDAALLRLAESLDGVQLDSLRVGAGEVAAAEAALPDAALRAIDTAIANVSRFHEALRSTPVRVETQPGVVCERVSRPLRAVGLYVPAGSAPLPSTAIMLAVPSRIAGCGLRAMVTPPRRDGRADPAVVVAARRCGIEHIFKAGGAQAVAALAYGTETVPRVDKIFGPGNTWVTAAKTLVASDPEGAALDMPAGPSEVMVIAGDDAHPRHVALDLLSQAEHGPDSHVVLICHSVAFAQAVRAEITRELPTLSRRSIIARALDHAVALVVPDEATAIEVANGYAPEHLIIQNGAPRVMAAEIHTAGSVFLGPWTPESVGDYCSGTNHVLPTYGYARSYSGLSVADFERRMTLQELTADGLRALAPTVTALAGIEGLDAHARAVGARLDELEGRS